MRRTLKAWLVVSIATTLAVIETGAQRSESTTPSGGSARLTNASEFESWVDSFLAEQTGGSQRPSLGLVVVKDGNIFFQKGYGQADDENDTTVSPDQTLFRAASVSKLVTATAVMQLVERGGLNLDADINTYLTRFQLESTYPSPITARHLLTHTSGVEDRLFGNTVSNADRLVSLGDYFAAHVPRRTRPPGEQIAYSNTGVALAGHLVEAVSGLPFEEYVFQPLGMHRSSFRQPYPAHLAPDVVPSGADGGAMLLYPSGSMINTVADMGRFIAAHLNGGRLGDARILSEETVREMHRQQFTGHARMPGIAYGFFENHTNGKRVLFHTGLSGHQSLLCLLPEADVGFYLALSARQGGAHQDLRRKFMQAFLDRYYPAARAYSLPAPPSDFMQRATGFTGVYRPNLLPRTTIETLGNLAADTRVTANGDGTLTVSLPPFGAKSFRIVEVEPLFFRSEDDFYFSFGEDARGDITRLNMSGSIVDPVSFNRLRWYESGMLHAVLAATGFFLFLSFCLITPVGFIRRRFRKAQQSEPATPREPRLAWRIAFLVSLLVVLSPVLALAWYHIGDPELRPYKIASTLYVSLGALQLAALLGLTLPVFAFKSWKRGYWSPVKRIYFSVVAFAGLLMIPFFYYWNLLGFRF
jgi:CubicO group peptidase (beta-lactamase class C family)